MAAQSGNTKAGENDRIPRHIAIIMDGNGRWARKRGLPRTAGHAVGAENFRKIATTCKNMGMDYLTVYAFSTENWKRPTEEVGAIMKLLKKYLDEAIETMARDKIRMKIFGNVEGLSAELQEMVAKTDAISAGYEGFQANICLNYGGRDEIVRAAMRYARDCAEGKAPAELTEDSFSSYLYSAGIPDPELIIRTGGEKRVSNFLLWQCAYSEFYYTDVLWPDFGPEELEKALEAFRIRERRFGAV
ncbi:MAG: isoprenyl transferase [Oscillospiraceae bacterium]|nr:isoprenyl transferase [Oscillospiraceae bacterium]